MRSTFLPRRAPGAATTAATAGVVLAVLLGAAGTAHAEPRDDAAPAPLVNAPAGPVAGDYLVTVDAPLTPRGAPASPVAAAARARARGAHVRTEFHYALQGFAATLTAAQLDAVRHDPDVVSVEPDGEVWAVDTQSPTPSWGLDRIDQATLPLNSTFTYPATTSPVTVYVIDTGIKADHPDFGGRVGGGVSQIADGRGTSDCNGHGTHVAGTIGGTTYGVAKTVRLVPVRVLNCQGSGAYSGVIAGIDWVTAQNPGTPEVANMSLGGPVSPALDTAVANSITGGVTYAIAAGNSGVDACTSSPADVPAALTVGATDRTDLRASWSNYGTCVDLFAPGVDITSDWNTGKAGTKTISGTSMASPHVAGVAALYRGAHPTASPAEVAAALVGNATRDTVGSPGSGSPNLLLFSPVTP